MYGFYSAVDDICRILNFIVTARKRNLRRLCFYTCLSVILFTGQVPPSPPSGQVHPQAGTPPKAGTPHPWAGTPQQCMLGYGQQAGGMHPSYIISDHLGVTTHFGLHAWFIKKYKRFNHSHTACSITTLTLSVSVDRPLGKETLRKVPP